MRCTSPQTVGFLQDGKTLTWSPKHYSKEYAVFQIPCRKCLACRIEYSRETAVRCVHEAQMYENNIFLTLTYSDQNLVSKKLQYKDIQKFIKDLRHHIFQQKLNQMFPKLVQSEQRKLWKSLTKQTRDNIYETIRISVMAVGEYGESTKRPHWHLLIFNYRPMDATYHRNNEVGDKIYKSETIDKIWGKNDPQQKPNEIGEVNFKSAGYVARYSAKKLVHGKDGEHEYEPISRRSSKNAIGKKWIEKYYKDVFALGSIVLPGGQMCGVPKYYERWLKKNHPVDWENYIKGLKTKKIEEAIAKEAEITLEEKRINVRRQGLKGLQISRNKQREKIQKAKYEQLKNNLK
ncbi:MAG: replication initiator protein [Arizlama microvirus]|nr:MAG: replication initiator protein [Arizlama microvirus]